MNSAANESTPQLAQAPSRALSILVIGGTHGIGLETVKLALERGHKVTALARHPERIKLKHPQLLIVQGDVLEEASLRDAVVGQDAVVLAIGMGLSRKPVTLFATGTANVLNAMEAADVHRLVTVTGIGAGNTSTHGGFFYDKVFRPLALQTVYDDKDRQEALIRECAFPLDWTIARPGVLGNGKARHQYRVLTDLTGINGGNISRADTAHFIVAALENGSHIGAAPLLIN
jgi:putative NADH-flavin reductase